MSTIFEEIVDGHQLENWVSETLQGWWRTYAREFERSRGMAADTLPEPRSWIVAEDVNREGADQLPAIVIVSPGLNGDPPKQNGDGTFNAKWTVGVGAFVSASTREDTKRLVRQYCGIIRSIMLQKQSYGGNAAGSTWLDESYDDNFNFTDDQTISFGQVIFDVEVAKVINRFAGPVGAPDPIVQPGEHWPVANTVQVQVVKEDV